MFGIVAESQHCQLTFFFKLPRKLSLFTLLSLFYNDDYFQHYKHRKIYHKIVIYFFSSQSIGINTA